LLFCLKFLIYSCRGFSEFSLIVYYSVVVAATGDAAKASPQTIKIVPPPGGAVLKAGINQAGKSVMISKPQGGGPGQIVTLVKTSSGMTVAQVISSHHKNVFCLENKNECKN
jgi:hypothetical protein